MDLFQEGIQFYLNRGRCWYLGQFLVIADELKQVVASLLKRFKGGHDVRQVLVTYLP